MQSYSGSLIYNAASPMMMPTYLGSGVTSATAQFANNTIHVMHMGSVYASGATQARAMFRIRVTGSGSPTWAEVGIYRGPLYMMPVGATSVSGAAGPSGTLERVGWTSVASHINALGATGINIPLSTALTSGDELWFAVGISAAPQPQFVAIRPDWLQCGIYQTASGRISNTTTFTGALGTTAQLLPMVYLGVQS